MKVTCPSDDQIRRLLESDLEPGLVDDMSEHLDACEACRQRLEAMAAQSWAPPDAVKLDPVDGFPVGKSVSALRQVMDDLMASEASRSSGPDLKLSGKRFGEFEILEEIAQGGMGIVYRARQPDLNRMVALKLLGAGTLVSSDRVARFRTETEAVAIIEHPNIVPIYAVGEVEGRPYFSMKLIEGGSLAQRLEELSPAHMAKSRSSIRSDLMSRQHQIVNIMISICRAIYYTHERGILHRDLKPNNVLLDEHGEPQITDFGLAKILEKDSGLTDSFAVMGTPSYMAPEQATGNSRQLTTAADIYGLGAIFYELLCGVPPFREATPLATMRRVIDTDPEPPRRRCAPIDADLETICLKALNKEPDRRYATAQEMAADLDRWKAGEPVMARPISWFEKAWRWSKRNPLAMGLGVLICLLLVIMVAGTFSFGVRVSDLYRQSEALVTDFQLEEVEELLNQGESMAGIAFLGTILEKDPSHEVAASRLVSALIHRDHGVPKRVPIDHGMPLREVLISPDQQHVASLGVDGRVRLWSLTAEGESASGLADAARRVLEICFDSSGDRLIGGCDTGEVVIWNVETGGIQGRYRIHDGPITALSPHPGAEVMASASGDRTVRQWDLNGGQEVADPLVHPQPTSLVAYGRGGEWILTGSTLGTVWVWSAPRGKLVGGPFRHFGPLRGAQFDPLERRIVTYGLGPKAIVWDVEENRPVKLNIEHRAPITAARFNPDGRTLVTTGEDGFARLWDSASGKLLQEVATRKARVEDVNFGPLGRRMLLIASGGICQLWDGDGERQLVNALRHPDQVTSAAITRDGRAVVTGCKDGKIRFWKVGAFPHWETRIRHQGPVNDGRFTPDGKAVATGGQDGMVKVSSVKDGLNRFRPVWHRQAIGFLALSPSGEKILVGENSPGRFAVAGLWSGLTGERLIEPIRHRSNLICGAFSPDSTHFVLGTEGGRVAVWPLNNRYEPLMEYHHSGMVHSVTFDPGGTRVMSAGSDGQVIIASPGKGLGIDAVIEQPGRILRAVFHPSNGTILTASAENVAQLWDLVDRQGQSHGPPMRHEDAVNWCEFSPDGSRLLTASADGTVVVRDVETQERVGLTIRHSGPVHSAHFDPGGQRILVVGGDRIVRVWHVGSGHPLTEPLYHSREVKGAWFSPDGSKVLTCALDDAARIWSIPEPPLPVPAWFTRFLGSMTGISVDSKGARNGIPEDRVMAIRQEILTLPARGFYEELARWILESGEAVRMRPHSKRPLGDYTDEAAQFGGFVNVNEALRYVPTHAKALGQIALLALRETGFTVNMRRDADYFSRLAVTMAPSDPEMWRIRAEVMRRLGGIEAEWEAQERFMDLTGAGAPPEP